MENQEMMPFFYPDLPYIHETDSWFNSPDEKITTESSSTSDTCKPKKNKRVPWAECEDRLLCELVAKHGEKKWKMIAEYIPGRTGKQCRQRWFYNLAPGLSKARWTSEEDALLLSLHDLLGNRWAQIRRYLPGRSENDVKNRFHCLVNRRRKCSASPALSSSSPQAPNGSFSPAGPVFLPLLPSDFLSPGPSGLSELPDDFAELPFPSFTESDPVSAPISGICNPANDVESPRVAESVGSMSRSLSPQPSLSESASSDWAYWDL